MANNDINININGKYNAKSAYKAAEKDMDSLDKKAKQVDNSLKKTSKGVSTFGAGASGSANKLKSLGGAFGTFNSQLGGSISKIGATQGAMAGLTAALGGPLVAAVAAAGAAIAAFGVMSYQKAVQSQAEWAKFKGIVQSAGQDFENSKQIVKDYAYTAGRSVGEVRTAFSKLTAAGINPSGQALRAVNELALGLGTNMESAAVAYNRIMQGKGGRTLSQLGIKTEDIMSGGKIDGTKLQAILEQKYGKAADNFAGTSQAAGIRLQTAIDGMMVAFGSALLGPATDLQNALAWAVKGLTQLGGYIYNLFGGANAWSDAMAFLNPAIEELKLALSDLIKQIFPNTQASGQLKIVLTLAGALLAGFVRALAMTINIVNMFIGGAKLAYSSLVSFGRALYALPGTVRGYLVSAGQSIYSAARNFGSWIWSSIQSAIPRLIWPSPGQIGEWIRSMIWSSRGPGGIASIGSQIAKQSALRTANLAAQRQALKSTYNSSPAAQSAASTATSNMGIFGSLSSFFGPGDWKSKISGMSYNYQNYGGSRQKAWDGSSNCMTGNCVDMSLGVLNAAAAAGARGGSLRFGTWNGGPHVWAEVEGVTVDPARKALNGTFAAPPRGPANGGGNTYVFQAPVYDWNAFKQQVMKANDRIIGGVF